MVLGGRVTDRTAILLGAGAGALIGAACGFLFLTERGRRVRENLEPRLAELVNEFQRIRLTADRVREREAWGREYPFDPSRAAHGSGTGEGI
jgi:hypothetical protein